MSTRFGYNGKDQPRPASTYRANNSGAGKAPRTEDTTHDRATLRGLRRSQQRAYAGRWPGVGDPGTKHKDPTP